MAPCPPWVRYAYPRLAREVRSIGVGRLKMRNKSRAMRDGRPTHQPTLASHRRTAPSVPPKHPADPNPTLTYSLRGHLSCFFPTLSLARAVIEPTIVRWSHRRYRTSPPPDPNRVPCDVTTEFHDCYVYLPAQNRARPQPNRTSKTACSRKQLALTKWAQFANGEPFFILYQ